jgi:hypothetical protein
MIKKHRDWIYYHRRKDTFFFKDAQGNIAKINPKSESHLLAFEAMVKDGYGSTVDIRLKADLKHSN